MIKNIERIFKTRSALKSENSVDQTYNLILRFVSVLSCIVRLLGRNDGARIRIVKENCIKDEIIAYYLDRYFIGLLHNFLQSNIFFLEFSD